jgi:hypothetical protein
MADNQNRHPERIMCSLSQNAAPLRSRGAGGVSWYSIVRGSLERHGDTFFSLGTLPVKSYSRLTAKNGDLTKRGSQPWGVDGSCKEDLNFRSE